MVDPITPLPPAPSRTMTNREEFVSVTDNFLASLQPFVVEINAFSQDMNDRIVQSFTGTSATTLSISTGTKIATITADMALVTGHLIFMASTSDPANKMTGTVTTYDPITGGLILNVTSVTGSGTFSDWAVGLDTAVDLSAYVTLTGTQTITGKTINLTSNTLVSTLAQINAAISDADVASIAGAETLSNKTLASPIMSGTPTTDVFAITDGASVTIDPAEGEVQTWALGASRTPTLTSITAGKAVLLMIDDGTAYTLTLSGVTWLNNGAVAPTLKTTGYTPILLFNIAGTLYAWLCGDGG